MDLIGHCITAELSGVLEESEIYGPGLLDLMLPNILHCHDWAYHRVWSLDDFEERLRPTAKRIRSHIVADWVIHYGSEGTTTKRKCGWAYKRMKSAHMGAEGFFSGAMRLDLLTTEASHPSMWSKKRWLDFSHSIVEYALDATMAPRYITGERLANIKRYLSWLGSNGERDGRCAFLQMFRALGAESEHSNAFLTKSIDAMVHNAESAREAVDFAIATTMQKYGFRMDRQSYRYVRDFIEGIASEFNEAEVTNLFQDIAKKIAHPEQIFTGPCISN